MTSRFADMNLEELLAALRADDWAVAVHNDYKLISYRDEPERKATFWLFTHPSGIYVKGEAETDTMAVRLCAEAAHAVFAPSP